MKKFILVLLVFAMTVVLGAATDAGENIWVIAHSRSVDTFFSGTPGFALGKLKNGTKVIPFEATDYYFHVKFPDGQTGWVDRYFVRETGPGAKKGASKIPRYNRAKKRFYRKDKLENRVLGKSKKELSDQWGPPGALIKNKDSTETWHYSNVVMVDGSTRYPYIKIQIQKDKATSIKPEGRKSTSWVEKLPLAYTLRGMSFLNITEPYDFLGFTKKWHWIIRIPIALIMICVGLLFFTLPGIGAFKLSGNFQEMKKLSNKQVLLAGFIVMFGINYFYFLYVSLHMMQKHDDTMAVVIIILLISTLRYYYTETQYHRCAKCHAMKKVADKGTKEIRRQFIFKKRIKTTTTYHSDGSTTTTTETILVPYTRIEYEDCRECTVCNYSWSIPYTITIPGHVHKTPENSPPKTSLNPRRQSYVKKFKILYKKIKALYKRFF